MVAEYDHLTWNRSGRCEAGSCLEVAVTDDGMVVVRQSDNPDTRLVISLLVWREFLAAVRAGGFD